MRLAVTGTTGQVALSLAERGAAEGHEVVLLGRPELDLAVTGEADMRALLTRAAVDAVVSAGAYTAVDRAESEPDLAQAVNAGGAGRLAAAAAALGLPLIHLSTDYVFDGSGTRGWREDDPTGPQGVYGASKLAGEEAVLAAHPGATVLRTAWVYSPFGANFVKTMLRLAESRDEVGVVADQFGNPTSALDIADGVLALAARAGAAPGGLFHMAGSGETSWAGLAEAIFAESGAGGGPRAAVRRIATADYPTPARRPANSRLDCGKLERVCGLRLPDWRLSLATVIERLVSAQEQRA